MEEDEKRTPYHLQSRGQQGTGATHVATHAATQLCSDISFKLRQPSFLKRGEQLIFVPEQNVFSKNDAKS